MFFVSRRLLQVRIGKLYGKFCGCLGLKLELEHLSPLLFSLMINDMYADIVMQMGVSLFVDDGAIWKRGRNVDYIVQEMQAATAKVVSALINGVLNFLFRQR